MVKIEKDLNIQTKCCTSVPRHPPSFLCILSVLIRLDGELSNPCFPELGVQSLFPTKQWLDCGACLLYIDYTFDGLN